VYDADISLEDSGNYTCEINGPLNSMLGSVTHYLFVRGRWFQLILLTFVLLTLVLLCISKL